MIRGFNRLLLRNELRTKKKRIVGREKGERRKTNSWKDISNEIKWCIFIRFIRFFNDSRRISLYQFPLICIGEQQIGIIHTRSPHFYYYVDEQNMRKFQRIFLGKLQKILLVDRQCSGRFKKVESQEHRPAIFTCIPQ